MRNPLRLGELVGAWTSQNEIRMDREIKPERIPPRGPLLEARPKTGQGKWVAVGAE